MKLATNPRNPAALKILVAANLANVKLEIQFIEVAPDSKHRPRLPILLIGTDVRIFSTNAAATYFMELAKSRISTEFENMLHFEAQNLFPLITSYLGEKGDSDVGLLQNLCKNVEVLEKSLQTKYFTGTQPHFADAILWATLFPLFHSNDANFTKFTKVHQWMSDLEKEKEFKSAMDVLNPAVGREGMKLLLLCNSTAPLSTYGERSAIPAKISLQEKAISSFNFKKTGGASGAVSIDEVKLGEDVTTEELESAKFHWSSPLQKTMAKNKGIGRILPLKDEKNYFITSALPYVNNVPHLGNIIGCVLSADVFARYCRMRGRNTLYICGTDEYGTATETKALEENLTPRQICDKYHRLHSQIYTWFNISFDFFGRTTTDKQTEIGQNIFTRLNKNGYLKEMSVQQLFCVPCSRFLSDRFVEGTCPVCNYGDARGDQCDKCGRLTNSTELKNPRCKVCSSTQVIIKESDQFFLDLPLIEEKEGLSTWVDRSSEGWTFNSRNIAKSWLKEGLKERCITRDLKWGTPVPIPKYSDKVFYVWFDAPIGYISMTACYTDQWEQWWINPQAQIEYFQFMAKDNVPFHSILFPASLKGTKQDWTLVRHIIATEYLNYEDGKFSKSRGIGVFGNDAMDTGIGADMYRFYLIFIRPESQDSAFSWDDFMMKNNSELLNNLGNFINRSLSFIEKFFDSTVPPMSPDEEDFGVIAQINREVKEYMSLLELCKLRDALRQVLAISKIGNQYFQARKPWTLNKETSTIGRCGTICGIGVQIVYLISVLLDPFMPSVGKKIRGQLGVEFSPAFISYLQPLLPPSHKIGKPSPLFVKLEQEQMTKLREKYGGKQDTSSLQNDKNDNKNIESNKTNEAKTIEEGVNKVKISPKDPVPQQKETKKSTTKTKGKKK